MCRAKNLVKLFLLAALALCAAPALSADGASSPQPFVMYFYNPSCRLCTATNEIIAKVEEKYKGRMELQRFDIADPETGADDVMYMFDLMDELKLPETDNTTLVVFIGLVETVDGEVYFTPKRALVDGENIIEKLDAELADFLANEGGIAFAKEGGSPGHARQARFFSPRS